MTIIVRKASIPVTGTCITAALIFGGMATPANAADDQSNNAPIAAGQVADAAGAKVVVDETDGGQVRIDIPTTVAANPKLEAVLSHVAVRDGEARLDYSAAAASDVDPAYLN